MNKAYPIESRNPSLKTALAGSPGSFAGRPPALPIHHAAAYFFLSSPATRSDNLFFIKLIW